MKSQVLVTGISGYIACHVALALLKAGYRVRGTIRSESKSEPVKQALKNAGADISRLSFIVTDLDNDRNWDEAVKGCDYIQHIASPFPLEQPTDREALVPAARAGAQRVLSAGFAAGVKRIVMTSSMLAMTGKPGKGAHLQITEDDWTDPEWRKLTAYPISKTRAELSAWEYAKVQGFESKLTVVNPGFVLGPPVGKSYGASLNLIERMFKGELPRAPKVSFIIGDVRDVAQIHVAAMTAKNAKGRRLIAASETYWMKDIAAILRGAFPDKAAKLPKGELPSFVVQIIALFEDRLKPLISNLDTFHTADNAYVKDITGVSMRPVKESIIDSANYLIENGKI